MIKKKRIIVREKKLGTIQWYEDEYSKTGWENHGWVFEDGEEINDDWGLRKIIDFDKFGHPIAGIFERIIILTD